MYKYGKGLRGWIHDEGELMELSEIWNFTATLEHLQTLLHSAKHLQVDLHTFLCCLSEEIPQAVLEQLWKDRWQELHGIICLDVFYGDVWND